MFCYVEATDDPIPLVQRNGHQMDAGLRGKRVAASGGSVHVVYVRLQDFYTLIDVCQHPNCYTSLVSSEDYTSDIMRNAMRATYYIAKMNAIQLALILVLGSGARICTSIVNDLTIWLNGIVGVAENFMWTEGAGGSQDGVIASSGATAGLAPRSISRWVRVNICFPYLLALKLGPFLQRL